MKVLAVVQARMSSSRFPEKVMKEVNNRPIIEWQIERILRSKEIDRVIVATTVEKSDDVLADFLKGLGVTVHRGPNEDVLTRFEEVSRQANEEAIVRITADCPLFMPEICDEIVKGFRIGKFDYFSNTHPPTYPDGLDIEIFTKKALYKASRIAISKKDREHVTLKMHQSGGLFKVGNLYNKMDESSHRWTLDYPKDLDFIRSVYEFFQGRESTFNYTDVMNAIKQGSIPTHVDSKKLRNIALRDNL